MRGRRKGVDLKAMICTGPDGAYEALQLYKSKVSRLRNKGQLNEALLVATDGTIQLLKSNYESAGIELSKLFIELIEETSQELSPDNRSLINQINESFVISSPARAMFLRSCVKYSMENGQRVHGDPILQSQLGEALWRSGEHRQSLKHYVLGESPESLWSMIVEDYGSPDNKQTRHELGTLSILYFLAYENIRDANTLMTSMKQHHGSDCSSDPLIEFCDRLLQTSLRDAKPLFKVYSAYLNFDPAAMTMLKGPIAKNLFGIESAPNMMSMIQNMLGGL